MSKKNFFDMSKEERQKTFWEMSDEDIDFSDIPEINPDFVKTLKRFENYHKPESISRYSRCVMESLKPKL